MIALEKKVLPRLFIILPLLALGVDLLTPFLIWKNILPAEVRWGSQLAIALMILFIVLQALASNHIPRVFWLILAVSIIWSYVALGHRQGLSSTLWGVWLLLQFPMVSVFMYLQPNRPKHFPMLMRNFVLILLGIEVMVQLLQYVAGEPPGDDLAGFFGNNGTGNAIIFEILVICVMLGHWITSKRWQGLAVSLILSAISSALGEMKLFLFALLAIGLTAVALYASRHRALRNSLVYTVVIFLGLNGFVFLYNFIVPVAARIPLQSYYLHPGNIGNYLSQSTSFNTSEGLRTDIGRADAVKIGFSSLNKDPVTLLFGYGIGARSESRTFGTAGVALTGGTLGLSVGTSLLVFMQEMGLIGLLVLFGFIVWVILCLRAGIRENPLSPATELRYGLILFTLFLPIWVFYTTVWTMRVPMFMYWLAIGYVFAEHRLYTASTLFGNGIFTNRSSACSRILIQ